MTQPQLSALSRLAEDFTSMSRQMQRMAGQLGEVERVLAGQSVAPAPIPVPLPTPPVVPVPPPPPVVPVPPPRAVRPTPPVPVAPPLIPLRERLSAEHGENWIGKLLAVAGVALAGGLVGIAARWNRRPGGRTGAIALAATGIATAYIDVIAVTIIYHWLAPVVGLLAGAAVGGGGLTLARRWDSQQLALLVLVPLLILAPIVVGGVDLLLIGFMLALSAATLPVQLGRDWLWMHAARVAAPAVPLLIVLLGLSFGGSANAWLIGAAAAVAALLAIVGALLILPSTADRVALALLTVAGCAPVLLAGVTLTRVLGALLTAGLSLAMLAVVTGGQWVPGMRGQVTAIFAALSGVAAVIAVTTACDGYLAAPVLLALALVVGIAGRHGGVARGVGLGFAGVGALLLLEAAPPSTLVVATALSGGVAASVLAASLLLIGCAVVAAWSVRAVDPEQRMQWWVVAGVVLVYAVTLFTVTLGVLVAGTEGGFLAGHMAATICWIAMAAGLFALALRGDRDQRAAPIAGGLTLTAAAAAKLFLFDLGTLDGMFRVAVFIVVGLVLLGMGAGYARSLADKGMPDQP